MSRTRAFAAVVWLACTTPTAAAASPEYSPALRSTLELSCDPSCLLCHTRPQGGFATANTKLGVTLRKRFDAQCCDPDGLEAIVHALEQSGIDSDGDGVSDVAELRAERDPNLPDLPDAGDAGTQLACQPPAKSEGCALAPGRGAWGASAWGILLTGALAALRRRR